MIDMNKQYTYNGKPVRIYADGSDTYGNYIHGAMLDRNKWEHGTFLESDLAKAWEPKEGELCYLWDKKDIIQLHVRKFKCIDNDGFYLCENGFRFKYCAPFKGELPEAFKGLV